MASTASAPEKISFKCEWFDSSAGLDRPYVLSFFPVDGTVEIYDVKNKRMFLRRVKSGDFTVADFYIGGQVVIYSRQFKIIEYADKFTQTFLEAKKERCCFVIKPEAYDKAGIIINSILKDGLTIAQMRTFRITKSQSAEFFQHFERHPQFTALNQHMHNDLFIGMDIVGEDAIAKLWEMSGDEDPEVARRKLPESFRAKFGIDWVKNAVHVSAGADSAQKDLSFLFAKPHPATALLSSCTLCIILPHLVKEGKAGVVIQSIVDEGFDASAMELFTLDKGTAFDFLQVYQQVWPEFTSKLEEFVSGPCIAIELRGENVHKEFRDFCGPYDPAVAKYLSKRSLRAIFGKNRIENAVHCTDLPDDVLLECEYFFHVLQ